MKMKLTMVAAFAFALACSGCSSSSGSSSGGGSSGVFCSGVVNGVTVACAGFKSLPASDQKTYKDQCIQQGQTIGSACPTDNLVGCCTQKSANGYSLESCMYGADSMSDAGSTGDAGAMADSQKQNCESNGGTWSTTP